MQDAHWCLAASLSLLVATLLCFIFVFWFAPETMFKVMQNELCN